MNAFPVAVINEAEIPETEVAAFVAAAEAWLVKLVAFWPDTKGATVRAVAADAAPTPREAQLVLAPTTTHAGTLGYHDKTPIGMPVGIVEIDACRQYAWPWTIAACHELGEMLVNPKLDRFCSIGGKEYPIEICDPVTCDQLDIQGVPMANATSPDFWNGKAGAHYDLMGRVKAPLPQIPHLGWLEWSEKGTWASAWGADLALPQIAYLRTRQGRRWRLRGKQ